MRYGRFALAAVACAMGLYAAQARAGDFLDNFDSYTTVSSGPSVGGFVQFNGAAMGGSPWQVQAGEGGGNILLGAGIDTNGVGPSKALFSTLDSSAATGFVFWQIQNFFIPAEGSGTTANTQVSYDIRSDGADSNTPWQLEMKQANGFDAVFTAPTLTLGTYTHVSQTLSQATISGTYDPAANFSLAQFSSGAEGFDAGNAVHIDNFAVTLVPEPATLGLLAIGGLAALRRRR